MGNGPTLAWWGIEVAGLCYEPVGFGIHHYRVWAGDGTDWFVNVDELAAKTWLGISDAQMIGALEKALGTAVALREAGARVRPRSAAACPPRGCVAQMTGGYAVSVLADLPVGDSLEVPNRPELFGALQNLRTAWTGGPYAEPAWQLVRAPVPG